MDPENTLPLHSEQYDDVYEINFDFLFKKEEPDFQIDLTADDDKDSLDLNEYYSEINLLNVADYLNKNQSYSYQYDNLEITDHMTSNLIKENNNSFVHNNECTKTSDKNEELSSDHEFIFNLDEYCSEMEAFNVAVVHNESNKGFDEYQHIKDVTEHINTTKHNSMLATNKDSSTDLLRNTKITKNNDVPCDKLIDENKTAVGNTTMYKQSVALAENYDSLPSINETGCNNVIEKSDNEANDDSSDDETLANIKKSKELEKHKYTSNKIIEATTLLTDSIDIKFIELPSTSKGYLPANDNSNKDDEDSIGYHSSDFELISESEAEAVGYIKNKKHKSKDATRKFSVSSAEYKEQSKDYKKINNDYRKEHVIPRGNDYFDMFRLCAPMWGGFMENKAFHVTSMSTEFEGLGFDLSMMPRYDDREDEEHIAEAKEAAKYIERMYPRENRRRHQRQT